MTSTSGPTSVVDGPRVMKTIAIAAVSTALLVGGFAVTFAAGQSTSPATPPLVIESMYGPDLYRLYCATCHGRDGKGNGPAAAALKVPPPDLTAPCATAKWRVFCGRRRGDHPRRHGRNGAWIGRDAGVGADLLRVGPVRRAREGAHHRPGRLYRVNPAEIILL